MKRNNKSYLSMDNLDIEEENSEEEVSKSLESESD